MNEAQSIADGLYRLVKREEDHNPVFPSEETIVEVRGGEVINLSTQRGAPLDALLATRTLHGPLASPYEIGRTEHLHQVNEAPDQPENTRTARKGPHQA